MYIFQYLFNVNTKGRKNIYVKTCTKNAYSKPQKFKPKKKLTRQMVEYGHVQSKHQHQNPPNKENKAMFRLSVKHQR